MTAVVILLLIAVVGFGFAVYQRYDKATGSIPTRIWTAVIGAAAAVGAAFALIFGQGVQ